jgi:hypothetical protein
MEPEQPPRQPSAAVLAAVAILRARSAARRTLGLPFPVRRQPLPVDAERKPGER